MPDRSEGSVLGSGPEEMLPERGDPFAFEEQPPRDLTPEELAELYPSGSERSREAEGAEVQPPAGGREDRGMSAVGPQMPDDLFGEVESAAEVAEPSLPDMPVPTFEPEPPREASRFSTAAALPSPSVQPPASPAPPELDSEEALVNLFVSDDQLRDLWAWADTLRGRVYQEIDNLNLARRLLDQIEQSRNQLMASRDNFEEAERILGEVEFRIHHAGRVREWSRSIGTRLLLYELVWALAIVVGMLYLPSGVTRFVQQNLPNLSEQTALDTNTAVFTLLWGGLGGVVGALVALRTHVARDQDFDRQWSIWYVTNPMMGVVMGAFVFLIVRAGLFALLPNSETQIQSIWLVYAFAWLAGFQQNVAFDLVERVVKVFALSRDSERDDPDRGG